jgi:hypothetical protein
MDKKYAPAGIVFLWKRKTQVIFDYADVRIPQILNVRSLVRKMHSPGFEPGSQAWKARILAIILQVQ